MMIQPQEEHMKKVEHKDCITVSIIFIVIAHTFPLSISTIISYKNN